MRFTKCNNVKIVDVLNYKYLAKFGACVQQDIEKSVICETSKFWY